MAEQEKKEFVITPSMKAAQEKLDNMDPKEREAKRAAMREKLRRYYSNQFSPETMEALKEINLKG